MSKGAYYQGLLSQQGIATTGPDFGQISDKFTEKILAVKANQAAADKIAYQQLKDAADAKNAFLKEQREIGSKLFNRDKFDGTGIGDFDAMAEKAKASVSAEFEGNNAMVDYIGQDAVRAKNNNIVKGYSDFLGVIQGAQEFMKNKADLDSRGLSSYTDDLKINYLAELSKNAKFDIDANGTVYITTIGEDGETLRSVPLSEVKAMLYNDIGANVDDITSDILKKQEKGKKVFQVGTTEYTKYISGGQTELSKEATDLVRTATAGLSYPQKIDALSELQRSGQSFIVSQQEYDQMNEQERKDKVVVGIEDVFKKDKEAQVDRLLEMGLSNKIFNELKVMESQEQVDPAGADGSDANKFVAAPVGITETTSGDRYDLEGITKMMMSASDSPIANWKDVIKSPGFVSENPDLYYKDPVSKKMVYDVNSTKINALAVPGGIKQTEIGSIAISDYSGSQFKSIDGLVLVEQVSDNGVPKTELGTGNPIIGIRILGGIEKGTTTTEQETEGEAITKSVKKSYGQGVSKPLKDQQLVSVFDTMRKNNKALNDRFNMISESMKKDGLDMSNISSYRSAVIKTIKSLQ